MTAQLLKEQNKYDKMPLGVLDRLSRILPLANQVADEIVGEETSLLEKIIPRLFDVMYRVAKFSCYYVKYGRPLFCRPLRAWADDGITGGSAYREKIEEMDKELTRVIEDLCRAVDVEALRLAKQTGKHLLSQPGKLSFSAVACRAAVVA